MRIISPILQFLVQNQLLWSSVTLTDKWKSIIIHNGNNKEDSKPNGPLKNCKTHFVNCIYYNCTPNSYVDFHSDEKPRKQTECRSIYYQIWHDTMICGTGLMLVKTRRGVSRIWTKTKSGTGPTSFGQYLAWHLNADAFTMWHHIATLTWRNVQKCRLGRKAF